MHPASIHSVRSATDRTEGVGRGADTPMTAHQSLARGSSGEEAGTRWRGEKDSRPAVRYPGGYHTNQGAYPMTNNGDNASAERTWLGVLCDKCEQPIIVTAILQDQLEPDGSLAMRLEARQLTCPSCRCAVVYSTRQFQLFRSMGTAAKP
jgi:hypothetical protein